MTSRSSAPCLAAAAVLAMSIGACVDRLPDQDLRVLSTTPAAKLSVDMLLQEFHSDARKARGTYDDKAVEIT